MSVCGFCGKEFGDHQTPMKILDCLMGCSAMLNDIRKALYYQNRNYQMY